MSKIFLTFLMILCALTFITGDAYAKRFGGGRSFGVTRSVSSLSSVKNFASPNMRASANRWMGPLAGMVAGGLLASLFMHNGIGSGMLSWIALAAVGIFLFNLLRNRTQIDSSRRAAFHSAPNVQYQNFANTGSSGFDVDGFLRDAKVQFLRMQTAYDQKNLNDIRVFTTPEVFGEIQVQLQERGNVENVTEVPLLNAELINVDTSGDVASVRFHGMVRENVGEEAVLFNETWHFQRSTSAKWLVAGIQQN